MSSGVEVQFFGLVIRCSVELDVGFDCSWFCLVFILVRISSNKFGGNLRDFSQEKSGQKCKISTK